ncbi:hypothetical protein C7954_1462 [Halanaerobium congolense]|uniref:Uncharacterized protein n=1 Tax=Halanaerobium congolense TaxID=54121 RepID=A0A4V3GVE1_9FIRM|nr:hypothetical protein [Halanaerobium congolense]TDX36946.1 hypothetical protein C7954_1462 [Halanaerobium congolense]
MGIPSYKIKKRQKAKDTLSGLINNDENVLIIHYSCESFYNIKDGRTPRVTSIAIRFFESGQTKSFSIHKIAEREGIALDEIESDYDDLEYKMLNEYFEFVKEHKNYNWIHWNMRDMNYGFEAIKNRFSVLDGEPVKIKESKKYDLARIMVSLYGLNYIGHPRLKKLVEKNGITKRDFLTGKREAECFESKEFVKLHQSTLRKVDIFQTIIERWANNSLETNSNIIDIYGLNPQGVFELVKNHWLFYLISTIFFLFLGGLISNFMG